MGFDFAILDFIRNNISNPVLDEVMSAITRLGNGGIIWIALAAVMILSRAYRKTGFKIMLALILSFLICNVLLKPIVARTRPFDINTAIDIIISKPADYSFPSGHTSAAFAAAITLILSERKLIWIPASAIAVLIAFSRLYLYVHFPSDVLCGIVLGTIFAFISVKIVDKLYLKSSGK